MYLMKDTQLHTMQLQLRLLHLTTLLQYTDLPKSIIQHQSINQFTTLPQFTGQLQFITLPQFTGQLQFITQLLFSMQPQITPCL